MKKSTFCFMIAFAILNSITVPAHSESSYPSRPIRLLVGFAAGGPTDIIARVLAKDMSVTLGQSIYVENKVGATSSIAIREVKNSAPDGYTLLFSAPALNINPLIMESKKVGFNPKTDFTPISLAATLPMVVVNAYNLPIKTISDLIRQARLKPGTVSFGSSGIGGPGHLAGELLAMRAKVNMMHVPFKGNGPALLEVMAGRVDFIFYPILGIANNVAAKRIKILAVGTPERLPQFPNAPTMSEAGFPGFEETAPWVGLLAPAHTPATIINRLNDAMLKALAKSSVKSQLQNLGAVIVGDSPSEFSAYLQRDYSRWEGVIKAAKIKPQSN